MSKPAAHLSLRDAFAEAMDDSQGTLEHIVALTYEFDDQQLLNLLVGKPLDDNYEPRKSDLQRISAIAPVVIYDSRKTREMGLVPHFMELLPVRMPAFSCHHPKSYLIVMRDAIHLIVGSMNLTRTGMLSNREVFKHFKWRANETDDLQILSEFIDILEKGHQLHKSKPLEDAVRSVRQRVRIWGGQPHLVKHFLVHSGYSERSGLQALAQIWSDNLPEVTVEEAFAVSPFFDKGVGSSFAHDLRKAFGNFSGLKVVTDAASARGLAKPHFGGASSCALYLIAEELKDAERDRIQQANDGVSLSSLVLRRKLHAKVLVLHGQGRGLVYMGSANFTRRAWDGTNRELGIAWVLEGDPGSYLKKLVEALSAGAEDRYGSLTDIPEVVADDEDYEELAAFPDFVHGIQLIATKEDEAQFVISGEELHRLDDYEICWGKEVLHFEKGLSNALRTSTLFARLIGGRNLRFAHRVIRNAVYYLPFRHSPELFEQRECLINETAADWIAFQIGAHSSGGSVTPGEQLPGEEGADANDKPERASDDEVRNANSAIRMQHYLHLFARLESEYRKRAEALLESPPEIRLQRWDAMVNRPLSTLTKVLHREWQTGATTEVQYLFKLGELALLWKALHGVLGIPVNVPLNITTTKSSAPLLKLYIDHCAFDYVH